MATVVGRPTFRFRSRAGGVVAIIGVFGLLAAGCGASDRGTQAASANSNHKTTTTTASSMAGMDMSEHRAMSASSTAKDLNGHVIKGVKAQDVAAETQPDTPLDAPTRAVLRDQLVAARAVAMRFPTAADATAAGYHLIAGFGPGSGAHYISFAGGGMGTFDPSKPPTLIYDGTSPTSQVVGLMFLGGGATAPEGFAGPNDHWHRHSNVCTTYGPTGVDVPFAPDTDVTEAQCKAVHGNFMKTTTWMVHAWVVPAWDSPSGVFSHENPNLRCADGTFHTDKVGKCQGS